MPSAPWSAIPLAAGGACLLVALALLLLRRDPLPVTLLALATGAALVALPWLAATPALPTAEPPVTIAAIEASPDGLRTVAAPSPLPPVPGRQAVRIDIEAAEAEPNDTLAAANAAALGTAIAGALGPGDLDFFAFDPPPGLRGEIVAALTVVEGDAGLTLYDDAGEPRGGGDTHAEVGVRTTTLARLIEAPRYYVLVRPSPGDATAAARYHLTVAARR
jgi:hypothetical protein